MTCAPPVLRPWLIESPSSFQVDFSLPPASWVDLGGTSYIRLWPDTGSESGREWQGGNPPSYQFHSLGVSFKPAVYNRTFRLPIFESDYRVFLAVQAIAQISLSYQGQFPVRVLDYAYVEPADLKQAMLSSTEPYTLRHCLFRQVTPKGQLVNDPLVGWRIEDGFEIDVQESVLRSVV